MSTQCYVISGVCMKSDPHTIAITIGGTALFFLVAAGFVALSCKKCFRFGESQFWIIQKNAKQGPLIYTASEQLRNIFKWQQSGFGVLFFIVVVVVLRMKKNVVALYIENTKTELHVCKVETQGFCDWLNSIHWSGITLMITDMAPVSGWDILGSQVNILSSNLMSEAGTTGKHRHLSKLIWA